MDIRAFWSAVLSQDRKALPEYFCRGAVIRWHCSNERFTVEEYVRANCDYPGQWAGEDRTDRADRRHGHHSGPGVSQGRERLVPCHELPAPAG